MKKSVIIYSITNILWLAIGFFLLIGPYNTGFLGFIFWIICGFTLNEINDKVVENESK